MTRTLITRAPSIRLTCPFVGTRTSQPPRGSTLDLPAPIGELPVQLATATAITLADATARRKIE